MTREGPGQVLFRFVRYWARRPMTADAGGDRGRLVLACEAVHGLGQRGLSATVNAIANDLGIDQSGASRLVKGATATGYLAIAASETDGRRRELTLTPAGRLMLDQAHAWQEDVFVLLTADWSEQRRYEFQKAMTDLLSASQHRGVGEVLHP